MMWAVTTLVATPFVIFIVPQLIGMDAYVVTSGSMEPQIPKGSVIYVEDVPATDMEVGDVITFIPNSSDLGAERVVHRVVQVQENNYTRAFKTKGDSNSAADPGWTPYYRVLGKKTMSVPYLGYLISGAHTLPAVIMLVLIPGIFLVRNEVGKIMETLEEEQEEDEETGSYVIQGS